MTQALLAGLLATVLAVAAAYTYSWLADLAMAKKLSVPKPSEHPKRKVKFAYNQGVYTADQKLGRIGAYGPEDLLRVDLVLPPYGFEWLPESTLTSLDDERFRALIEAHDELAPYAIPEVRMSQ